MILIVGGQGSGKRDFVRSLGFTDADCGTSLEGASPVLLDLHLLVKDIPAVSDETFANLQSRRVVVCNEVGCGIVPVSADDRAWRDRVGRTCARLARDADRVVRLCCGIPQDLKGGRACG